MNYPPTRSGKVLLRPLTDQEALATQSETVLIIQTPSGLAPLLVQEIRMGVAGDSGQQTEVPVIVGQIPGGKTLVYAVPDCLVHEDCS